MKTSLGVSNVSFGLPQRENITSAFFLMALQRGLDAAIMNPKSEAMMRVYRSYCALSGWDENCMAYIAAYGQEQPQAAAPAKAEYTLREAVEKGLKDAARQAAESALQSRGGLALINEEIVPALDAVGERFEKKTLFLPQLLMSAEAAKAAFEVIKAHLQGQGDTQRSHLTIVIATVKGGRPRHREEHCEGLAGELRLPCGGLGQGCGPRSCAGSGTPGKTPSWWG